MSATRNIFVFIVAGLFVGLVACGEQGNEAPVPAAQEETANETDLIDPREFNDGLTLPEGFRAQVVHEIGWESRELIIRENGDLIVSLSGRHEGDVVLGLRDLDGDFVIDETVPILQVTTPKEQKFPRVHIAYAEDTLYTVTNEQVLRQTLPEAGFEGVSEPDVVIASIPYQSSHRGRTITLGPDGWLYVNIGSPSNACQQEQKTLGSPGIDPCPELIAHAGIWRWPSDQLKQPREAGEHYAIGIRNSIAQAWDRTTGTLYVAQMGRDRLDSLWPRKFTTQQNADLPGEEFFRVEQGKEYGWPYCYWDPFQGKKVLAPEYGGDGEIVGRCDQYEEPLVSFPAHYSPSSIAFYHADALPERYHGGAFVALKGSWNRAPLPQDGFNVVFVPFEDGAPTGDYELFADGFKGFDILYERGNAVYRPQYIAVHPDGSLYILDNNEGRIWRVTYTGEPTPPLAPRGEPTTDRTLITSANMGRGEKIYMQYCAACHQPGGGGVPGEFPPLTNTDWVSGDKGRLIRSVLHGMEGPVVINGNQYDEIMPAHDFLRDRDLAALLTYVRKEFGGIDDPVLGSEVLLVRNGDNRSTRWPAAELETKTGIPGQE